MRKRRHFIVRRFRCPECGTELTATKMWFRTGDGHVKTMYCYVCKEERDCIQIDIDRTK